jgi:hypothetical protein
VKRTLAIVALGVLGWGLCGSIMFVGMALTSLRTTLIVHAVGAPVIFAAITWIYFRRFRGPSPLRLALGFEALVVGLDLFVVALVINRSFDMFRDPMGTWVPFTLIFLSAYLTGRAVHPRAARSPNPDRPEP